jgi:glycopeptide antibiotics resistance protein
MVERGGMIHFFPIPFLIGSALLAGILIIMRLKGRTFKRLWTFLLFGMYILLLIDAVIFPLFLRSGEEPLFSRETLLFTFSHVNWRPFYFGQNIELHSILQGLLQNIVMTIPFGFGLNFLRKIEGKEILIWAAGVGFATEISQLLVSLFYMGGPYRGVDINDVLCNAAGVLLGFGLYRLAVRFIPALEMHQ